MNSGLTDYPQGHSASLILRDLKSILDNHFIYLDLRIISSWLIIHYIFQDGDRFWRMPECYIRGSTIKYLRIPDEVIDMVKEDTMQKSKGRGEMKGRGGGQRGRGGRGKSCSAFALLFSE